MSGERVTASGKPVDERPADVIIREDRDAWPDHQPTTQDAPKPGSDEAVACDNRKLRCVAVIWKRDTYRYTGRTKSRFEMHYTKAQCSRAAVCQARLCRQHAKNLNPLVLDPPYFEWIEP